MYFTCCPEALRPEEPLSPPKYAVRLRSISQLWTLAFGQFLELWVVPPCTRFDESGRASWSPRYPSPELLLVLLHLNDGITRRFSTSFLHGLCLQSYPRPFVRGLLAPRPLLVHIELNISVSKLTSSEVLQAAAVHWFPNLTPLSLCGECWIPISASSLLQLPATMEALSLSYKNLATDDAVQHVSEHFLNLRELTIPLRSWTSDHPAAVVRNAKDAATVDRYEQWTDVPAAIIH